jgi:hypothetical protein
MNQATGAPIERTRMTRLLAQPLKRCPQLGMLVRDLIRGAR